MVADGLTKFTNDPEHATRTYIMHQNIMPSFVITLNNNNNNAKTHIVPSNTSKSSNLETGRTFLKSVDDGRIEDASNLLADSFFYTSATFNAGKGAWLLNNRKHGSTTAAFGELLVVNDHQVHRKGTRKVGFLTIRVKEVLEFDSEGMIQQIIRR